MKIASMLEQKKDLSPMSVTVSKSPVSASKTIE
jgi:hypothetical protein